LYSESAKTRGKLGGVADGAAAEDDDRGGGGDDDGVSV